MIYLKIILSLSPDQLTAVIYAVLRFLLETS